MQAIPAWRCLRQWVTEDLGFAGAHIEPASADASFRRYFRLIRGADSYIVMDAPPEKEAVAPFIGVAQSLLGIGLNVPVILARDPARGLLLLSDLGTRQYLSDLVAGRDVERLYSDALDALVRLQTRGGEAARALPPYDRAALIREMELLPEWFLGRHLGQPPTAAERAMLDRLFETLAQSALAQPARVRASRLSLAQFAGHRRGQSGHPGFSGCRARCRDLRCGLVAEGLLHCVAARAGHRLAARAIASG